MTLIMLATIASGALINKLLLMAHVEHFAIRYPVAVLLSYLIFFGCVRLWLAVVASAAGSSGGSIFVDPGDFPLAAHPGSGAGASGPVPMRGGGGEFAGGGATGDFDLDTSPAAAVAVVDAPNGIGGAAADAGSDVASGLADGLGDEGGLGILIAMAVLAFVVVVVLGASLYVVYQAPVILSEAAFQGMLAATLARSTLQMTKGDWVGSVFKATWRPFIIMLAAATIIGMCLKGYFPEATRLADIWR